MSKYPIEDIPDSGSLFRRIHPDQYNRITDTVLPEAFIEHECSVNWDRYSSPEATLLPVRKKYDFELWRVAVVNVGKAKATGQEILHRPGNRKIQRAHSLIFGEKLMKTRDDLAKLSLLLNRT